MIVSIPHIMLLLSHFATLFTMANLARAHYMSQVHWTGTPYEVQVLNVTRPNITSPTDAIVRITRAAICGSDLHNYRGFFVPEGPVGHEAVGIVSEIGSAVTNVRVGDHVIIPSSASNGYLLQVPEPEEFFFGLQGEWGRGKFRGISVFLSLPDFADCGRVLCLSLSLTTQANTPASKSPIPT